MSAARVRVWPTSVVRPSSTYDVYCPSGPERSCSDTGTTARELPPPLTRTASEVTAAPLLGTQRHAYVPPATVATSARNASLIGAVAALVLATVTALYAQAALNRSAYLLPPLPNLFFTRVSGMVAG